MEEFKIKFNPDDSDAFAEDVFTKIIPSENDEQSKKKASIYGDYREEAEHEMLTAEVETEDGANVFAQENDGEAESMLPESAPSKETNNDKTSRIAFVVATVAIVVLAGICGYLFARLQYKKQLADYISDNAVVEFGEEGLDNEKTKKLGAAYRFILENYYKEIAPDDLIEGAIKGMTDVANDPYSHYYSPEKMKQYENLINGVDDNGETIPVVSSKELDNCIKYVKIDRFSEGSAEAFKNELEKLQKTATDGIIIDLRGNPGGFAEEAISVADVILPKGKVATAVDRENNVVKESESDENCISVPVVLLVNEKTASAAELLTGAFRDFKKGEIIGTKTFGKALAQIRLNFNSDNSGIVLSAYKYFTPSGECIDGVGIEPTIKVEDDTETEEDEQLERAINTLTEAKNK